jgi:peptidyl-prolyl cis-trans isomerase A (cyclophilin A)
MDRRTRLSRTASIVSLAFAALAAAACNTTPSEPPAPAQAPAPAAKPSASATAPTPTSTDTAASATTASAAASASAPAGDGGVVQHGGADPLAGKFGLPDATKGLKGTGPITATIDTSNGPISCKLYDDKAPNTVANFVGLARGIRPWKDPKGDWVKRPAYDGTTFHRIIKGFMIQGGDPVGNGTGEPGYVIKDEIWPGAKHDRAGLLCMANRGHDTNGQQFFITDAAAAHLDGNYTIFGECTPEQTVHDIASVPLMGEKPTTPVTIKTVTVVRK